MMLRPLTAGLCVTLIALPVAAHEVADQPGGAAKLHVRQIDGLGPVLVDQAGTSLYLFEADREGESTCHDACATSWPPLITEGEPEAHDDLDGSLLDTLDRGHGEMQVTYDGWPLYYFSADAMPGHTRGHDIEMNGGEWYLVTPEGEPAGEHD